MKKFSVLSLFVCFSLTAACGIQEKEPGSSPEPTDTTTTDDPTDDPVEDPVVDPVDDPVEDPVDEPTYIKAPFKLSAVSDSGGEGWRFEFARAYISGAECGEALGVWSGVLGWGAGEGQSLSITERDEDYLSFTLTGNSVVASSEIQMTYTSYGCAAGGSDPWAQYGDLDNQLSNMSPEALEWVYCGWVEGADGSIGCNIRMAVSADEVVPHGNMREYLYPTN